jgi:aryl-alcohol dehydrogenase-like predicted oxidoreductase
MDTPQKTTLNRRTFIKSSAAAVAGAAALSGTAAQGATGDTAIRLNEKPDQMTYRKLGRTNFMSSRLIFGGGAALSGGRAVRLLDRALESGINCYDLGSNSYYKQAENNFAPFFKSNRDNIFVISKAPVKLPRIRPGEAMKKEDAQAAAKQWTQLLDQSLSDLQSDYVDAYYIMMVDQPTLVNSEEMLSAFNAAKAAGKVKHFGISTHYRAEACLEAAIDAGFYDLAMIALSPAGWYNPNVGKMERDTPTLKELRPILDKARESGIGLIGMKAARYLSMGGKRDPQRETAFDSIYEASLMKAPLSPYQRSYAYCLENGLDVVIADMQNFKHFEENVAVARDSATYFA